MLGLFGQRRCNKCIEPGDEQARKSLDSNADVQ